MPISVDSFIYLFKKKKKNKESKPNTDKSLGCTIKNKHKNKNKQTKNYDASSGCCWGLFWSTCISDAAEIEELEVEVVELRTAPLTIIIGSLLLDVLWVVDVPILARARRAGVLEMPISVDSFIYLLKKKKKKKERKKAKIG